MLLAEQEFFNYFNVTKVSHFKIHVMKNQVRQKKTVLAELFTYFAKNFAAFFESSNKREFQRLKDFITS